MGFFYLQKRKEYYYFRIRVPKDLKNYFPTAEIKRSLKTKRFSLAKQLARRILFKVEQVFTAVRLGMLTDSQIKEFIAKYIDTVLTEFETDKILKRGMSPDSVELLKKVQTAYGYVIDKLKEDLALGNYNDYNKAVETFISENNLNIEKDSFEYNKLCRELLKAKIEIFRIELERLKGNYSNDYDLFLKKVLDKSQKAQSTIQKGEKLSSIIDKFIDEKTIANSWTEKTLQENKTIYNIFLQLVGDRPITEIDREILLDFRNKLVKLPSNLSKKREYRGKSLKEILSMEIKETETLSLTTVNKYLTRISSLFNWALKNKYISVNYAEGLTFPKKTSSHEERSPYSKADLERIIENLEYDEKRPERFWIPLIVMYSGLRLNEACQLYVDDIIKEEGIYCFDINDKKDKKLKSKASKRKVPIHPVLIELGFIDYWKKLKAQDKTRLWENLKKGRDGYGHHFGRWFQTFNRNKITKDPKKVFHSFRHNVANELKQLETRETIIAAILGHSDDSTTTGRYGKTYKPKVLLNALEKIDYGIDLSRLKSLTSKFL